MKKPKFDDFENELTSLLGDRQASLNLRWVFRQNLALSHVPQSTEFKIYFQTFSPAISRDKVAVFYRRYADALEFIGAEVLAYEQQYTLCALLFDPWDVQEDDGDVFHEDQGYGFALQRGYSHYQEVTDRYEWWFKHLFQSRRLSGLDFVLRYKR